MAAQFLHRSVLLREVVEAMTPRAGGRYVDGTVGGGGHASALLEASRPDGFLFGLDQDATALAAAREKLEPYAGRFELRQANFRSMADWVPAASSQGVLLDLGVSSPQLDQAERGFSFQQDGPLDMRMDARNAVTAADLVNEWSAADLAKIFWELAEEPQARRIARAIAECRTEKRLETTAELARLVERVSPRRGAKRHPATRVFQALRMAVNEEVSSLESGLAAAWLVLAPRGRLAVITFHSLEDRVVKLFGREKAREYTVRGEVDVPELREPKVPEGRWVTRKPVEPGAEELAANPRARSAKLRVLEKI